ncbi:prephenate dehydrogenase [Ornithinibacillus sp. 4-3]|uniref:Prephenate dehydrogenase n=1 Tax=Ornithinibacillus sp. 4-3 TaxID=3231488 RepID=A0AB39HLT9_9BACI
MKYKILIAGLGLIGGSIAKAIGKANQHTIIGYDTNEDTIKFARENNIIQESYPTFTEAATHADIIFLAAPISKTIGLMEQLNAIEFDHHVIVTDVSSVKGSIIDTAQHLSNKNISFIGGHPMAGSHKNGIRAAKEHLFENAMYILTPTTACSEKHVDTLKEVLKETKSHFVVLNPQEHDEMTSVVSHFPHLIAASLVHQARRWQETHAYLPELAAGGFRDITRIASSNPEMWQDIFYHNGSKMTQLLDEWIVEMQTLKNVLEQNDKDKMTTYLHQAKSYRDGLNNTKRGALPSYFDLYVDVKDQPGAIASVAQLLADNQISLTNIRILEIRDDIFGALRLSVSSKKSQLRAYDVLRSQGYDVQYSE